MLSQGLRGCFELEQQAPALSLLGASLGAPLGVVTVTLDLFSVNKQIVGVRCSHGKMARRNGWYGCTLSSNTPRLCKLTHELESTTLRGGKA